MRYDYLSVIISAAQLVVTIISVIIAFSLYLYQKKRSHKEAACSLAKFYADSIINRISYISIVLSMSKFSDYAKKAFSIDCISNFDKEELEYLCKNNSVDLNKLCESAKNIDAKLILLAKLQVNPNERAEKELELMMLEQNNDYANLIKNDFEADISDLLNNMEYFAMTCRFNIADEKALFQSIHQTFLSNVWLLYYYISRRNDSLEDKYYTNIIWLFNTWRNYVNDIKDKRIKISNRSAKKITRYAESKTSRPV